MDKKTSKENPKKIVIIMIASLIMTAIWLLFHFEAWNLLGQMLKSTGRQIRIAEDTV